MANPEHVKMLVTSTAEEWNQWREEHPNEKPDLSGVELDREKSRLTHGRSENLSLSGRDLRGALFASTDFSWVEIGDADFRSADLECAWFAGAYFHDGTPTGLDDVLRKRPEYPSCDEFCRKRYREIDFAYPKDCAKRCRRVLHHDQKHVARLLEGVKAWNEWRDADPQIRPNLSGLDLHGLFEDQKNLEERDELDLTGINFNGAVLRGTQFFQVKLNQSTCYGADLRCSEWRGVEATAVSFRGADLRNAKMSLADMSDCDFRSMTSGLRFDAVGLSGSTLAGADLRGNSFALCNLSKSDLSAAHVCGSRFANADLTGAKLSSTRIWKAYLFRSEEIDRFANNGDAKVRTIEDVESLFQALSEVRRLDLGSHRQTDDELERYDPHEAATTLYYRGHSEMSWGLRPTVFRNPSFTQNECDLMSGLASRRPDAFRKDAVFFQRLVRARHFDLPTRLLDVTSNPLTALYYAAKLNRSGHDGTVQVFVVDRGMEFPFDSDTVSLVSNFTRLSYDQQCMLLTESMLGHSGVGSRTDEGRDFSQDRYEFALKRLIHFIAREKPYWEDRIKPVDLFKVILVKPESSFARLRAHDGAFLISAFHRCYDPRVVNRAVPGAGRYKCVLLRVPHSAKEHIQQQLRSVGVTEESLKSDLGSAAEAVADEIRKRPAPSQRRRWEE